MEYLDDLVDIHGDLEAGLSRAIVLRPSLAERLKLLERVEKLDFLRRGKQRPNLPKKIFLKFPVKSFRNESVDFNWRSNTRIS